MNDITSVDSMTYNDYSDELESEPESSIIRKGKNSEQNFPVKLHYMLNDMEKDNLDHIVSWRPHGRCFVVHKQERFVKEVLPLWFRQHKFSSFQRQLNLYGFKRITQGVDKGAIYHELFLRSKGFLARRIHRKTVKGQGYRRANRPEKEPDFYGMPFLPTSDQEIRKNNMKKSPVATKQGYTSNGSVDAALQNLMNSNVRSVAGLARGLPLYQHAHLSVSIPLNNFPVFLDVPAFSPVPWPSNMAYTPNTLLSHTFECPSTPQILPMSIYNDVQAFEALKKKQHLAAAIYERLRR